MGCGTEEVPALTGHRLNAKV